MYIYNIYINSGIGDHCVCSIQKINKPGQFQNLKQNFAGLTLINNTIHAN